MAEDDLELTPAERRAVLRARSEGKVRAFQAQVSEIIKGIFGLVIIGLVATFGYVIFQASNSPSSPQDQQRLREMTSGPRILVNPNEGAKTVPVWNSSADADTGEALVRAHAHMTAVLPYIACIADSGTKAAMLTSHLWGYDVQVINGAVEGCKGYVRHDFLKLPSEVKAPR